MMMMRRGRRAYVYSSTQIYQITENDGDHSIFSIPSYAPFGLPRPECSCWSVLFFHLSAAAVNRCQRATSVYFIGNVSLGKGEPSLEDISLSLTGSKCNLCLP